MSIGDKAWEHYLSLKEKHDELCKKHKIAGEAFDFTESNRLFNKADVIYDEMGEILKSINKGST